MPRNSRHTIPVDGSLYWKCCAIAALSPSRYTLNAVEMHTLHIVMHHYHVGRPVHVSVIDSARALYQECRDMLPRVTRGPDVQFSRRKLPLRAGTHPISGKAKDAEGTWLENDPAMELMVPLPDVGAIRRKLGMSQKTFSETYRIPLGMVKEWENGRRAIDAVGAAYLTVVDKKPVVIRKAFLQGLSRNPPSRKDALR